MRSEEQFDSFYLKTRRAIALETFALTGDLAATEGAVRDAFVAAWHHWRKVRTYEDPRAWVRPRAWALAQRRHTARLRQRTRDLTAEERAVLDALHDLRVSDRRALLLVALADVPLEVAARELNVTQAVLEQQVQAAWSRLAATLETDRAGVRSRLSSLGTAAGRATLPRPGVIRREGRTRRRVHTLIGTAAVTFLAVASGTFAHEPGGGQAGAGTPDSPAPSATARPAEGSAPSPESPLPSADDLLDAQDVRALSPAARWRVTATHDNTSGEGINYVCQQDRFADPEGLAALVRTLKARGGPGRQVVQTVEISDSTEEAAGAYDTVLSWFGGCEGGRLHLRRAFTVDGAAERAVLLVLQEWARPQVSYSIEVAQVGQVVSTTVVLARGGAPSATQASRILETASRKICDRAGGRDCDGRPSIAVAAPPPSPEPAGILTTVDMPPLVGVRQPWLGTAPVATRKNPASTTCDRADFRRMGGVRGRTRTFLVPQARLPDEFGLTETYAGFPSTKAAASFMRTIRQRFATCEDREVTVDVLSPRSYRHGRLDVSTWRLLIELSESRDVVYDVGFVRLGNTVAQLTFVPAGRVDLGPGAFGGLVTRAGLRLAELG